MTRIRVKKTDGNPESKEVLASAITSIGDAAKALHSSGLNERAVIVLLAHHSKCSQKTVRTILESMRQLESWYCK